MTLAIARQVRNVGADVARTVLRRDGPLAQRSIAAEVVAAQLCERIAAALEDGDDRPLEGWLESTFERYGALAYLPSVLENAALALMEIGRSEGWLIDAAELRPITAAIARAIHRPRARMIESTGDAIDDLDVTINNLVARLYEKDPLTGEHSQAVSLWCARLARKLKLDDDVAVLVQRGGLLHDIGKIATPSEILDAPRRLSADERVVIERHPVDGAEIVVDVPTLSECIPMVRSHHERLDGSGYPDRLGGDEISLAVRIVTVADCFNAMIGRRPYRAPLAPSVGLEELRRWTRSHFDPDVVEAMVGVVSDRLV